MPTNALPSPPSEAPVDSGKWRLAGAFAAPAAAAVAVVHAGLLVPLMLGWIGATAFAVTGVVLSASVVGLLSYRMARVLHNLPT